MMAEGSNKINILLVDDEPKNLTALEVVLEIRGVLRRGIAVIKMRGSQHDKDIREFTIDAEGMHLGKPFENVHNVILGVPQSHEPSETEQLEEMFER